MARQHPNGESTERIPGLTYDDVDGIDDPEKWDHEIDEAMAADAEDGRQKPKVLTIKTIKSGVRGRARIARIDEQ